MPNFREEPYLIILGFFYKICKPNKYVPYQFGQKRPSRLVLNEPILCVRMQYAGEGSNSSVANPAPHQCYTLEFKQRILCPDTVDSIATPR